MAHHVDLSVCDYFGFGGPRLIAVGWLEAGVDIPTGPLPDDDVIEKLAGMIAEPWQPCAAAGFHTCSLCRLGVGPRSLAIMRPTMKSSIHVEMGISNIFVPGTDAVYVAPSLVMHYLDAHEYTLPEVFVEAIRGCPPMGTAKYLAALRTSCPEIIKVARGA